MMLLALVNVQATHAQNSDNLHITDQSQKYVSKHRSL